MTRLVLLLGLAACKDPQRQDLELFCGPDTAAHGSRLADVGPAVESEIHHTEFGKALMMLKDGSMSPEDFRQVVAVQLADAHMTDCPILTKVFGPYALRTTR